MSTRVQQAQREQATMVAHRRYLHAHPEAGLELPATHAWVTDQLEQLGLAPEAHPGAGVTIRFDGTDQSTGQAPHVVLRVDMDALPVTERTGLAYASRRAGVMHACGHDLHTAVGLAVARVLAVHPPRRTTILAFQPGEETDRGAVPTLAAHKNLRITSPANAFAVHMHAQAPSGQVLLRNGTFMANGDWFTANFTGPGGHASAPERTGNPIEAGAQFVADLATAVTSYKCREHTVATVTEFLAGNTVNVIPTKCSLRGTIRTLSHETRMHLTQQMHELAASSAYSARVNGDWQLHEGYPAVINNNDYVEAVRTCLQQTQLASSVTAMAEPSMVIEDFSYFLHKWPGMMIYVGAHVPGCLSFNHADDVLFDEAAMTTSLALYLLAADGWPKTARPQADGA